MTPLLTPYLNAQIAQKISKTYKTGNANSGSVFARRFTAEIIFVDGDTLGVSVTSEDMTPSGMGRGGSSKRYGDINIDISDIKTKELLLDRIFTTCGEGFFHTYADNVSYQLDRLTYANQIPEKTKKTVRQKKTPAS